jgi:hypothetical protein
VGNWRALGAVTLSLASEIKPPSGEEFAIDTDYSAKAIVSQPLSKITLGNERVITKGIPVEAGKEYTFSFYAISASSESLVSIQASINWYGSDGKLIATSLATTDTTVSWAKYEVTAEAPGTDYVITEYTVEDDVVTVTTSETHSIPIGGQITIAGLGVPFDGRYTATSTTGTTVTFTLTTSTPDDTQTGLNGVVAISPSVYAGLEIEFTTTGTVFLDLIQLAESSVTVFNEARGVNIFLGPSKSNFVNNPSFSGTTEGWDITNASGDYVTSTAPFLYTGDTMLEVVSDGGTLAVAQDTNTGGMPTGEYYSFSVYAQSPTNDNTLFLEFSAVDSVNPSLTFTGVQTTVGSQWTRLQVTGYIPQEYVSDSLYFELVIRGLSLEIGDIVNLEAAQMEASFAPTLYIDGSFPAEYGIVWEGTDGNSPSHLYKNKQQKIIRLIQELENFLPSNTPYVVESFGGIETAAITM